MGVITTHQSFCLCHGLQYMLIVTEAFMIEEELKATSSFIQLINKTPICPTDLWLLHLALSWHSCCCCSILHILKLLDTWVILSQLCMFADLNKENQFNQLSFRQSAKKHTEISTDTWMSWKRHLLNSVLGVGFALPTHRRGRIQKTVLPYGVGSIAIQCLDHLQDETTDTNRTNSRSWCEMWLTGQPSVPSMDVWYIQGLCPCLLTCNWEDGHEEWVRCRTWELCRPKPRWMLQHSSQTNTPLLTEAQRGSGIRSKCLFS